MQRLYNYRSSTAARNIKFNKSRLVGVVVPEIPAYAEMIAGVCEYCTNKGYQVLVSASADSTEKKRLSEMLEREVGGLIVCLTDGGDLASLEKATEAGVKIVLADRPASEHVFDTFCADNYSMMRKVTSTLLGVGFEELALLTPRFGTNNALFAKYTAFSDEMKEKCEHINAYVTLKEDDYKRRLVEFVLENRDKRLAVIASDSRTFFGVIKAAKSINLRIPSEIAVIGYDNSPWNEYSGYSAVIEPLYDIGKKAAETLVTRLAEPFTPDPLYTELDSNIVLRASTELND